jgi:beta-fructofuranosidase
MFRLPDSWLWDFLARQERADLPSVLFLYASRALHEPDRRHMRAGVGHAVSTDLVRWERVADAIVRDDPPAFDHTATWTGSVVAGPDGTWSMFYTGTNRHADRSLQQQVARATSADLYCWVKDERNPLVSADPRWYETLGGDDPWRDEHWRDPWVLADPDGDGWHMLITGRANTGPLDGRGVVAHAYSRDLTDWEVRPPLSGPDGGFGQLEVFQVENVDGRWVLVFNCVDREFAAARAQQGGPGGVWVADAASALGPYDIAGATLLSDDRHYVGKLVRDPDGRWVFLAFVNKDENGDFVGDLTDPIPVGWDGDRLVLRPAG